MHHPHILRLVYLGQKEWFSLLLDLISYSVHSPLPFNFLEHFQGVDYLSPNLRAKTAAFINHCFFVLPAGNSFCNKFVWLQLFYSLTFKTIFIIFHIFRGEKWGLDKNPKSETICLTVFVSWEGILWAFLGKVGKGLLEKRNLKVLGFEVNVNWSS